MERWFVCKVRVLVCRPLKHLTEWLLQIQNTFQLQAFLEIQLPPVSHRIMLLAISQAHKYAELEADIKQVSSRATREQLRLSFVCHC